MTARTLACPSCGHRLMPEPARRWQMVIGAPVPSQNAFKGMSVHAYRRLRRKWEQWVLTARMVAAVPLAKRKRRLKFIRHMRSMRNLYDYGNYVGGLKPVLDACIKAGVVVNDTRTWLSDFYEQRVSKGDKFAPTLRTHVLSEWLEIVVEEYE